MNAAAWIIRAAALVASEADRLTRLDAAIGDGDHGHNLDRGFTAAAAAVGSAAAAAIDPAAAAAVDSAAAAAVDSAAVGAVDRAAPPGRILLAAGRAIVSKTGGASGPLYGTALRRAGKALGDAPDVSAPGLGAALRAALDGVMELGRAAEGDKTMVDALAPAVAAYEKALDEGGDLGVCARAAAEAAAAGADATVPLQARKGRASYLGERSIGHIDPGAVSTALILRALAETTES